MLLNDFHEKTSQMVKIDPVRDRQTMDDPSRCATAKQWMIVFQVVNITYDDPCPLNIKKNAFDDRFEPCLLTFFRSGLGYINVNDFEPCF